MSAFQSRKALISQLPRLVTLRIFWSPGVRLIAVSNGRVTVTIILFTGWRPLSAITFTFGKVTSGNNEDCKWV